MPDAVALEAGELRDDSLRFVLEAAGLGWWDLDLVTGATVRSLGHDALFGYSALLPSWGYEDFLAHIHPDDRLRVDQAYQRALAGGSEYAEELRVMWPDGTERWVFTRGRFVLADDGTPLRVAGVMGDIDERKRRELAAVARLDHLAHHDALTGQPNRAHLAAALPALLDGAHTHGTSIALLFLDLDEFKVVNDAAGHLVGDSILQTVAGRLSAAVREQDVLVRFGGDEFVVVCPDTAVEEALDLAERLHTVVRPPVDVGGNRFFPAMSVGVSHRPPGGTAPGPGSWETLVQEADTAMYDAKRRGRDRTRVFDSLMAEQVRDLLELTNDLRAALEQDTLELWYQPVVSLASGEVMGVEALARWDHPVRGPVSPTAFIAAAERSGLVTTLDQWALRRASRDAVALRAAGVLHAESRVAVNVSAKAVADGHLADMVDAGVLPEVRDRLVLEVTETGVMHDPDRAEEDLTALHATGVRFSIDDFGTGQSSLLYLRRFPVAVLKVDGSFVGGMVTSPEDRAIVRSVVSLALETGLTVVAEGIETPEQLLLLQDMGCTAGQGYLWTPALPVAELVAWVQAREA